MRIPPITLIVIAATTLILKFSNVAGTFDWLQAISLGLIAGGISGFVLGAGKKIAPILLLFGLIGFYAPQLSTGVPTATELAVATFSVTPTAITPGVQVSGDNIIVPLTYDKNSNTLDKDPVEIQYTIVRTDTGTQDAAFKVSCEVNTKITDDTTGLQYDFVEKNALNKYDIQIIDTADNSTVIGERTFQMKFGTTSKVIKIKINLNPTAFQYADLYESFPVTCNIAGVTSSINMQKTNEIS